MVRGKPLGSHENLTKLNKLLITIGLVENNKTELYINKYILKVYTAEYFGYSKLKLQI